MAIEDYELKGEYPDEIRYFNQLPNETWYEAWMRVKYTVDKLNTNNIFVCELVKFYLRGLDDESYDILREELLGMDLVGIFDYLEEFIEANEFVYVPSNETVWKEEYETAEADDLCENGSHTLPPESRTYPDMQDPIQILNIDEMEEPHVSLPLSDFDEVIVGEFKEEESMEPGEVMSEIVSQELEACHQLLIEVDSREDGYLLTHSELNYLSFIGKRPVVKDEDSKICSSLLGKVCDDSFDDINVVKHILQDLEDKSEIALEKRKLEGASATFLFDNCLTVSTKRHVDSPGNPVLFDGYNLINWVIFMDFKMDVMDHVSKEFDMVDGKGWVRIKVKFIDFSPYLFRPPDPLYLGNVNKCFLKMVKVNCFSPFKGRPPDILIVGAFKTPPW